MQSRQCCFQLQCCLLPTLQAQIDAVRADLLGRTDVRIYGEMKLRDEMLGRIAALQGMVEAAKGEGEDIMVSTHLGCAEHTCSFW